MQKTPKKESVIRLSAAHKHMSRSPSRTGERARERGVLPEAVAGNNGELSDGEAFNGALTALCW